MPICRASSPASSNSPAARLALRPVTATAPVAQGQLGRLGQHGAVQPAGKRHRATAEAAQQLQQAVALGGKFGGRSDMGVFSYQATAILDASARSDTAETSTLQQKSPPPQCRGDALLRARHCKGGNLDPGLCDPLPHEAGQRLYTRPEIFSSGTQRAYVSAHQNYRIGSTNMVEDTVILSPGSHEGKGPAASRPEGDSILADHGSPSDLGR